jgi:amidase
MKIYKIFVLNVIFLFGSCNTSYESINTTFNDFKFLEIDIITLNNGYKNGDFKIEEVTRAYIERIQKIDQNGPKLNSIIEINPDAIKIAKLLDEEMKISGSRGYLHGVPILLKDNINTKDKMSTTAGSRALNGSKPLEDSKVVEKLRKAGALILGKANLSEWANFRGRRSTSGWSGINGQTKNPYVLTRNPCGSSSGSGVSVSANLTLLAIGTETNGSIVCPSTVNGIVGIKPTVGLISRSGIIPISYTQDTAGPMARSVQDAAICLGFLTGIDENDIKTLKSLNNIHKDYTQFLNKNGLKDKRVGVYTAPLGSNDKVDSLFRNSVELIKDMGADVIEIKTVSSSDARSHSFQVMIHEYKDGLNNYFKSLGMNSPIKNLKELIEFNENDSIELKYFNQAYLKLAQNTEGIKSKKYLNSLSNLKRLSQKEGIDKVMNENDLDVIIAPTGSPSWSTDWFNGDNYHISSSSPSAWAGYPIISVPMGNIHGLPVGISFFGRAWSEPTLIEVSYAFEQSSKARIIPEFHINDEY